MTRSFIPLPQGTGIINLPDGGTIAATPDGDGVYAPEQLGVTETGLNIGGAQASDL